jgi:hypothetical protein
MWAKQSTAATFIVGPILDSAGAEFTTAVIGDLSISKNGGTLTALAAAATLTHIANGQYTLVLTNGNLDTLGRLQITCNRPTYQMPPVGLTVVPAMVFDSMVLGTDVLQSDVTQFGGTNGTFTDGKPAAVLDSAALRSALGMSAADLDSQLDAILAAATAAAGTGARTVTITVNDGTTVLQNAVVRFTEGGNTYRALTNSSGVATFNLDDATYTVAISKVGYFYAGTTMIVNGVETATYSMTAINVTPGTGDLTTGYLTCLDEEGVAEEGVSVRCQVVQVPASGTGFAYDSAVQLATSDADGLVEFPMVKGARYLVWRGSIKPPQGITPVLISASAGSTTALGSLIGD